jgi:hypothetical protein
MSVVPMHAASNGTCTCGSAECHSPGKHPRIRWQRLVDAPAGEEEVARWWSRWPAANVAVVSGRVSGVVVLDVDPRGGGDASLAALEDRWGRLPPAPETLTGGGGRHVWMRSGGDDLPTARVAPGLDLKAHAGLVTVPPSVHPSGSPYRWRPGAGPEDRDPPPVPQWLSRLALGLVDQEPRHPLADPPPRTSVEQAEFAAAWSRAGIELQPGDRYYLCPFHPDHHPSLHVDHGGCRWYCFGCRRGGGIGALRRELGEPPAAARRGRRRGHVGEEGPPTLDGPCEVHVIGEAGFQDELLGLAGGHRPYGGVELEALAELVPEPRGTAHSASIIVRIGGLPVGVLSHDDAVRLGGPVEERIRRHGRATCPARIRGGWDRGRGDVGRFGVVLSRTSAP